MDEKIKRMLVERRENMVARVVHGRVAQKNQQGNIEKGTSKELRHDIEVAWWDEVEEDIRSEWLRAGY